MDLFTNFKDFLFHVFVPIPTGLIILNIIMNLLAVPGAFLLFRLGMRYADKINENNRKNWMPKIFEEKLEIIEKIKDHALEENEKLKKENRHLKDLFIGFDHLYQKKKRYVSNGKIKNE